VGRSSGAHQAEIVPADGPSMASGDSDERHREKVETFLTRAMGGGPLSKVTVAQVTGSGDSRVGEWDKFEGVGPEHLATDIVQRAREDSQGLRGAARYVVFYFRSGGAPEGRLFFTMMGETYGVSNFEDPEPPNGQGLIAQHMRHTEISVHMSLMQSQAIISDLRRDNSDLRADNRRLLTMHTRVLDTYEELKSGDHQRQLEMRLLQTKEARKDAIGAQFLILLPLLLKHLVTNSKSALSDSALTLQLVNLFGSLEPAQLQGIMAVLGPAQSASVMDLYRTMREQVAMTQKLAGQVPPAATEPKKEGP
jgi:hypothetical protein